MKFIEKNAQHGAGMKSIQVDMNLIEVSTYYLNARFAYQTLLATYSYFAFSRQVRGGWFFKLWEREFVREAIAESDVGDITPRRYLDYEYSPSTVPYVKE